METSCGSETDTPTGMVNHDTHDNTTSVFRSTVASDISLLKSSVDSLKLDILALKGQLNKEPSKVDECYTSLIYVKLKYPTTETPTEVF